VEIFERAASSFIIWITQILIIETTQVLIVCFCLSAFYRIALDTRRALSESPYKNQYRRAAETETIIDEKEKNKKKGKKGERSFRYRSNATQMVRDNKLSASGGLRRSGATKTNQNGLLITILRRRAAGGCEKVRKHDGRER